MNGQKVKVKRRLPGNRSMVASMLRKECRNMAMNKGASESGFVGNKKYELNVKTRRL